MYICMYIVNILTLFIHLVLITLISVKKLANRMLNVLSLQRQT